MLSSQRRTQKPALVAMGRTPGPLAQSQRKFPWPHKQLDPIPLVSLDGDWWSQTLFNCGFMAITRASEPCSPVAGRASGGHKWLSWK